LVNYIGLDTANRSEANYSQAYRKRIEYQLQI